MSAWLRRRSVPGDLPTRPTTIQRGQATSLVAASVASAVTSYVVLLVAARTLAPSDNAIFLTFWAVLFGMYGVITGVSPEASRAAYAEQGSPTAGAPRVFGAATLFGAAVCGTVGVSSLVWADVLLGGEHAWLMAVVTFSSIAFGGYLAVTGVLVGRGQWHGVVGANVCETVVRLSCVATAATFAGSLASLSVATALSPLAWLLLAGRRDVRSALRQRADIDLRGMTRNFGHACVASASSAAMLVAFPVLLRLTTEDPEYLASGGLLLAISLTRAPLMVPLTAFQGVALAHFLRHRNQGLRALAPLVAVVLAVAAVGIPLAAVVGPWLFALLLGGDYVIAGRVLAGLTAGAGLLAVLTLTGMCCLAVGRHRVYSTGWVVTTVSAFACLLLPLDLQARTLVSLLAAPVVGIVIHLRVLSGHAPAGTPGRRST